MASDRVEQVRIHPALGDFNTLELPAQGGNLVHQAIEMDLLHLLGKKWIKVQLDKESSKMLWTAILDRLQVIWPELVPAWKKDHKVEPLRRATKMVCDIAYLVLTNKDQALPRTHTIVCTFVHTLLHTTAQLRTIGLMYQVSYLRLQV